MVTVAAAQMKVTKNAEENLKKIIFNIKKAASKKVSIVCFPETSLIHNSNKKYLQKADVSLLLQKIREACKQYKIHCIFSTNVLEKSNVYNRAYLIDDNGKILSCYNKINLWKTEKKKGVTRGNINKAIKTKFGKIGIIICWDIAYPEHVRDLAKKGAWIIFCPSYVINYKRELNSYELIPFVRSFENSCYVVYTDAVSENTVGYSYICSPQRILTQIRKKEGLIIAKLDKRYINGLRKYYGLIKH